MAVWLQPMSKMFQLDALPNLYKILRDDEEETLGGF